MSKLDWITIGIVAVCLVALIWLLISLIGDRESSPAADQSEVVQDYEDPLATQDDRSYRLDEDGNVSVDEGYYSDYDDPGSGTTDYEDDGYYYDEEQTERETTQEPTSSRNVRSSSSGDYMVMAGSFRIRENADERANSLRNQGYTSAEVALFNRGAYAVVIVDRFNNLNAAKELAQELKKKGVDAYVQEKRVAQ